MWLLLLWACEPPHPPVIRDAVASCATTDGADTWWFQAYVLDQDGFDDVVGVSVAVGDAGRALAYEHDGLWTLEADGADFGAACDTVDPAVFTATDTEGLVDVVER